MPEISPIRIVATGSVSWPPIEEMRAKIINWSQANGKTFMFEYANLADDDWIKETYKEICNEASKK